MPRGNDVGPNRAYGGIPAPTTQINPGVRGNDIGTDRSYGGSPPPNPPVGPVPGYNYGQVAGPSPYPEVPSGRGSDLDTGRPALVGPIPGYNYGPPMGPSPNPAPVTTPAPAQNPDNAFRGSWDSPGGYNSAQYGSLSSANQLARMLGGQVAQTRSLGPLSVPVQNSISFGGQGNLNAGLLAERYEKYDRETADRMTRDELKQLGASYAGASNPDTQGGAFGYASQFSPAQGGGNFLGQGSNMGQFLGTGLPTSRSIVPGQPLGPAGGFVNNFAPGAPIQTPAALPQQSPQWVNPNMSRQFGGFGNFNQFYGANQPNFQNFLNTGFSGGGQFNIRSRPPAFTGYNNFNFPGMSQLQGYGGSYGQYGSGSNRNVFGGFQGALTGNGWGPVGNWNPYYPYERTY